MIQTETEADGIDRLGHEEDDDRRIFQLVAEGLTTLVGFGAALINLVEGDDLVVAAVAGVQEARRLDGDVQTVDQMIGSRRAVASMIGNLEVAEDWGRFKFVRHGKIEWSSDDGWVSTSAVRVEGPDAWHPLDALIAPVYDHHGALCGTVTLDEPASGRYPTPAQLRMMDKYVDLAAHAITNAIERRRLAEKARLLETARVVVRRAAAQRSMRAVLDETGETMRQAFGASALWIRILEAGSDVANYVQHFAERPLRHAESLAGVAERAARRLWETDSVSIVERGGETPVTDSHRAARDYLRAHDFESVLYVPLGAGPECLGALSILRPAGAPSFTEVEVNTVRDIARDLGRTLLNARNLERERRVVRRLRDLDGFKSDLIARVADELGTPLAAIVADTGPLRRTSPPDPGVVARMHRNARLMARMADDLLVLARSEEQEPNGSAPTDLGALAAAIVDQAEPSAPPRVRLALPPYAALVAGDETELEQVITVLLDNARAYTPGSGEVAVDVRSDGDSVRLTVSDTGIGIAASDLDHVFEEFYRSADPRVRAHAGTGLGLSIVDRIVRRRGGRVEVDSVLDRGTTVRVLLPAASEKPDASP